MRIGSLSKMPTTVRGSGRALQTFGKRDVSLRRGIPYSLTIKFQRSTRRSDGFFGSTTSFSPSIRRRRCSFVRGCGHGAMPLKISALFEQFTEKSIKSVMVGQGFCRELGDEEVGLPCRCLSSKSLLFKCKPHPKRTETSVYYC